MGLAIPPNRWAHHFFRLTRNAPFTRLQTVTNERAKPAAFSLQTGAFLYLEDGRLREGTQEQMEASVNNGKPCKEENEPVCTKGPTNARCVEPKAEKPKAKSKGEA